MMYMNNITLVCPRCHGETVGVFSIVNIDNGEIYGYYGYCKSLRCKVRKVTYNKNGTAIHFTKWTNLEKKKKFLYEVIKQNRKNGNWKYRKKTEETYRRLKNCFANTFANTP